MLPRKASQPQVVPVKADYPDMPKVPQPILDRFPDAGTQWQRQLNVWWYGVRETMDRQNSALADTLQTLRKDLDALTQQVNNPQP